MSIGGRVPGLGEPRSLTSVFCGAFTEGSPSAVQVIFQMEDAPAQNLGELGLFSSLFNRDPFRMPGVSQKQMANVSQDENHYGIQHSLALKRYD